MDDMIGLPRVAGFIHTGQARTTPALGLPYRDAVSERDPERSYCRKFIDGLIACRTRPTWGTVAVAVHNIVQDRYDCFGGGSLRVAG
jgi:hypothetical protein